MVGSSLGRELPGVYAMVCKGAVPEPLDAFSSANTLSVSRGPSTFETEWRSVDLRDVSKETLRPRSDAKPGDSK